MKKRFLQFALLLLVSSLFLLFCIVPKDNLSAYVLQWQGHDIAFNHKGYWKRPTHFSCDGEKSKITQSNIQRVARMPHVNFVQLRNMDLTKIDLSELHGIQHWQFLDGNKLTARQIQDIADNATEVRTFFISNVSLNKEAIIAFSKHPIVHMTLANVDLNNEDVQAFEDFEQLERLGLTNSKITDEGLGIFVSMQQLKELDLRNTNVSLAGVEKLQSERPDMKIHWR